MSENQLFFVGLKAFIRKGRKLLVLQSRKFREQEEFWGLPGGRIQTAERRLPLEQVLLRELREECGANFRVRIRRPAAVWRLDINRRIPIFLVGFECDYLSGTPRLGSEHGAFAWIERGETSRFRFLHGYRAVINDYLRRKA